MSLSIKNILVQWHHLVLAEDQKQVLERLGKEKALLHIIMPNTFPTSIHITNSRVAALGLTELLDSHCGVPCPLAVLWIPCNPPQVEIGLDHFRTQDVVFILASQGSGLRLWPLESERLRTQVGIRSDVGLMARVCYALGKRQVLSFGFFADARGRCGRVGEETACETAQMVHLLSDLAVLVLAEVREVAFGCYLHCVSDGGHRV